MKKIKEIIVVEGKSDTALLKELFEVDTIEIRDQIQTVVPNCKHAFVSKKDATGKKKLGIAEANKEAVVLALENMVSFDVDSQSITWHEFIDLDIIGNKQRRLLVYDLFNLGYGNVKTLFKRLNMVGISKEDVLKKLDEHKERVNG